jgi:hypothetical protein
MKKFAAVVIVPLCAGYLFAQQPQSADRTETTTTKTTLSGTLLDAGCYKTHTEKRTTSTPDSATTRTETTRTESVECPATTTTTTFGLLTTDGKYIRFDEPSNTKVIQVVKSNKDWKKFLDEKKPMKVSVVGTSRGDVVVVETIK